MYLHFNCEVALELLSLFGVTLVVVVVGIVVVVVVVVEAAAAAASELQLAMGADYISTSMGSLKDMSTTKT